MTPNRFGLVSSSRLHKHAHGEMNHWAPKGHRLIEWKEGPMRSMMICILTGIMMTGASTHDIFADEPATPQTAADPTPVEPARPPAPEGSSPQSETGDVQERGVFRNTLEPKIFNNPQPTTPAPTTRIPTNPWSTVPRPGTGLPRFQYEAPTPNLTTVANALRLNHKSLTTLVTLPPNLPVTQPVEIGIIYASPTGIGQTKQSYAGGTGNRFLYDDREGDGKPRAMEITITLTEPSAGAIGIYSIKWPVTLDPLYVVGMTRFEFTLLNFCDTAGATEIRFVWALPDARSYSHRGWSTGIVPWKFYVPEFTWVRSEVSWSHPLHKEEFKFIDDDPGWVDKLHSFAKALADFPWQDFSTTVPPDNALLNTPTGGQWVEGVRRAENDPCKAKFKYWRVKNLLLYPALEPSE